MKSKPEYIDLHLHPDGAITVEIAKKPAALQGIKLPAENTVEAAFASDSVKSALMERALCENN